jgi:hypothetical protein
MLPCSVFFNPLEADEFSVSVLQSSCDGSIGCGPLSRPCSVFCNPLEPGEDSVLRDFFEFGPPFWVVLLLIFTCVSMSPVRYAVL